MLKICNQHQNLNITHFEVGFKYNNNCVFILIYLFDLE